MAGRNIEVVITGNYNDKDIKKAMGDLKSLGTGAHSTGGAFNLVGDNLSGFGSKLKSGFMEPLAGVGAAVAGAFALEKVTEFFKSSIEAAMEDEKALRSLAITMRNVGDATPISQVTDFVDKLAEQTGVTKEQLIPAYQTLLTATKDSATAQSALKLAMDVSAGGTVDLESATKALAKGYLGSTTALGRMGAGIDKAILATGDMDLITKTMSQTFAGQAAAAAETFSGKLSRISVAVNQAKEDIGYALMDVLDKFANSLGGVDGINGLIGTMGKEFANNIAAIGETVTMFQTFNTTLANLNPTTKIFGEHLTKAENIFINLGFKSPLAMMVDTINSWTGASSNAQVAQDNLETAVKSVGIAALNTKAGTDALAVGMAFTGDSADKAALALKAYQDAALTIGGMTYTGAAADEQRKSLIAGGGGGTPTAGYTSQYTSGVTSAILQSRKALEDAAAKGSGSAAKAADVVKMVAIDYAKATADINKTLTGLSVSISGGGGKVTQALADEFKARTDTFTAAVNEQMSIIKTANDAISSYSESISSTIMGQLSFKTAAKDAEGNDVNLKPDAIAKLMLGDIANQSKAVGKIAGIALKLPDALTKQILALPSDAAVALADYLSANPDMTAQLTSNYASLADQTKTLLGDPMANAFATVGGQSAVSMIAAAKAAITAASNEFQAWAASALHVTITMDTSTVAPAATAAVDAALTNALTAADYEALAHMQTGMPLGAPSASAAAAYATAMAVPHRASGGPVMGGRPYLVGENGPEIMVPGINGTIIPNGGMAGGSSASGNTYAITVNSGVGDPRQIGQDIVQYIRQFEQSSGRVFAKA